MQTIQLLETDKGYKIPLPEAGNPDCQCSRCGHTITEEECAVITVTLGEDGEPKPDAPEYIFCEACTLKMGIESSTTFELPGISEGEPHPDRVCRVCGCSDYDACIHPQHGNCWWEEKDLCSHCKHWPGESKRFRDIEGSTDDFLTMHQLPFEIAAWNTALGLAMNAREGWMLFRVGTCEGQWRCMDDAYEILSIVNSQPGNGHLHDVFEWFEHSCKRDCKKLRVMELMNDRFKKHLIEKRGFFPIDYTYHLEKSFN